MKEKQKRIIIDTNLFVSFLINKDFSKLDKIIIQENAVLILSSELVNELVEVISRPKFNKIIAKEDKKTLMDFFTAHGELIEVKTDLSLSRDNKDNFLLELAVDGNATHLITGDQDLLVLKKIKKTKIIQMKSFLSLIRK